MGTETAIVPAAAGPPQPNRANPAPGRGSALARRSGCKALDAATPGSRRAAAPIPPGPDAPAPRRCASLKRIEVAAAGTPQRAGSARQAMEGQQPLDLLGIVQILRHPQGETARRQAVFRQESHGAVLDFQPLQQIPLQGRQRLVPKSAENRFLTGQRPAKIRLSVTAAVVPARQAQAPHQASRLASLCATLSGSRIR